MSVWQMAFLALLIGVACGLYFRVWMIAVVALVGLVIGFASAQAADATWLMSALQGVALMFAVEIGYIIGAVLMVPRRRRRQRESERLAGHSDHGL